MSDAQALGSKYPTVSQAVHRYRDAMYGGKAIAEEFGFEYQRPKDSKEAAIRYRERSVLSMFIARNRGRTIRLQDRIMGEDRTIAFKDYVQELTSANNPLQETAFQALSRASDTWAWYCRTPCIPLE
eukprot:5526505-Pyramimonas_sp.AAC.1